MQVYNTPAELWESVAQQKNGNAQGNGPNARENSGSEGEIRWYSSAVQYWDAQAPTDDGVLGGYGFVSDIDVRDSKAFLKKAMGERVVQGASLRTADSNADELVALGELTVAHTAPNSQIIYSIAKSNDSFLIASLERASSFCFRLWCWSRASVCRIAPAPLL